MINNVTTCLAFKDERYMKNLKGHTTNYRRLPQSILSSEEQKINERHEASTVVRTFQYRFECD